MNRAIRILLPAALLLPAPASAQQADLIITNARVYTADDAHPRAQAVAVRGDRIIFAGSAQEANVLRGAATKVIDAAGRTVIPGMIDAHGHVAGLGSALRNVDLVGTTSYQEVIDRVQARARQAAPGAWIQGRGWDQNDWADTRFPTHDALSRAVPDHPVVLERIDGHAVLANALAMQQAGITKATPDPTGGRILRAANGEPTGVFVDNATNLIDRKVPAPTAAEQREAIRLAMRELNRYGLTGVHDAGVGCDGLRLYEQMARAREITARTYVMVSAGVTCLDSLLAMGARDNVDGSRMIAVRAVKAYADGALGSRGARLLEPYSDEPTQSGLLVTPMNQLVAIAVKALRSGFQLNVHAIGDGANREVLDVFEAALRQVPRADHRFRIEHAQVISPSDIPRFAQLGVIPSMQAVHQTSDMYWAENRLGSTRILGAYAWRSLLNTGVVIPNGSDFPVESANPLFSFHSAVTRQDANNWPAGGWVPQQRMTRQEALNSMTIWPAYASFQESQTGSLTAGKLADIVVLSQDIMTVPAEDILKTTVELTIVGGKIVYDATTPKT
ncbi:MAG TPA: amidohydrolase [Longimicrobiales bacterium]